MKTENKTMKLLAPIIVLVAICLVITAALAFTNAATAPVIAAAEQKARDESMQVVLPEGAEFAMIEGLTDLPEGVLPEIYEAGNGAGYVIFVTGKGYGGDMSIIVGLSADGKIAGTKVLTQNETAGIGSNVVNDGSDYQKQLIGMSDTSGIQATSGATVSSNGMKNALQAVFDAYTIITGGTVEVIAAARPANFTDDVLAGYFPGAAFTEVPGGMVSDAGTVVFAAEPGMMGDVPVAVCFDPSGAIVGVSVDASSETPGLGDLCAEPSFTDKFIGAASGDEVDAISGSTMTSNGVKAGVNAAIANLETVKGAA